MPRQSIEPRLLTKEQAAFYCGVSTPKFSVLCPVNSIKMGDKGERYSLEEIDRWIDCLLAGKTYSEERTSGFIYCVGFLDFVKIGYTRNFQNRIKSLQNACPNRLMVYFVKQGNRCDESDLHQRFDAARVEGEWFKISKEMAEWLEKECGHQ